MSLEHLFCGVTGGNRFLWSHHVSEQGLREEYCRNIEQGTATSFRMFQKTLRASLDPTSATYECPLCIKDPQ